MGLCFQTIKGDGPKMELSEIGEGFVWVVGRRDTEGPEPQWHIQGITGSEELAVQMCSDETYFIGPVPLNVALAHQRIEWVGSYFPFLRQ